MTLAAIKAIAKGIKAIENREARKLAVQAVLPAIYDHAKGKFNAVQFCLDCNVPALINL